MFDIDLKSRIPLYEQLYKRTIELIYKGVLKHDDALPSVRSLANELGINPNTVLKAYEQLRRDGIAESVPAKGYFVKNPSSLGLIEILLVQFDADIKEALKLGVSKVTLKERIDNATI